MKSTNLTPEMFRRIAEKYFNKPESINTSAGICYNLSNQFSIPYAYVQMNQLMDQMGYEDEARFATEDDYENYSPVFSDSGWQSRAYMCLIMAEMLEDGTLQINETEKEKLT